MKCSICSSSEEEKLSSCDECSVILCQCCANLSTTELRCIQLKKRLLIYKCKECREKSNMHKPRYGSQHTDSSLEYGLEEKLEKILETLLQKANVRLEKSFEDKFKKLLDDVEHTKGLRMGEIKDNDISGDGEDKNEDMPTNERDNEAKETPKTVSYSDEVDKGKDVKAIEKSKMENNSAKLIANSSKKIHLIADQQGFNIVEELTNYYKEEYMVNRIIHPLKTIKEIGIKVKELQKDKMFYKTDLIVICVGANETDPNYGTYSFIKMIKELKEYQTVILPVLENRCLNVRMLYKQFMLNLGSCCRGQHIKMIEPTSGPIIGMLIFALDCIMYDNEYIITGRGYVKDIGNNNKRGEDCKLKERTARQTTIEECFRKQFFRNHGRM